MPLGEEFIQFLTPWPIFLIKPAHDSLREHTDSPESRPSALLNMNVPFIPQRWLRPLPVLNVYTKKGWPGWVGDERSATYHRLCRTQPRGIRASASPASAAALGRHTSPSVPPRCRRRAAAAAAVRRPRDEHRASDGRRPSGDPAASPLLAAAELPSLHDSQN